MLKKITSYLIVFVSIGTISFFIQSLLLTDNQIEFVATLRTSYLFQGCFSFFLVVIIQILSRQKQFFNQLGFIYIGFLVFKLIVFGMMMQKKLLGDDILPEYQRAGLLVSVLIFIFLEVACLIKIFKQKAI